MNLPRPLPLTLRFLLSLGLAACTAETNDNFTNPPPGPPATCTANPAVVGCTGGSVGYACAGDRPDDGDTSLVCSDGTPGAAGMTIYCCAPYGQYWSDCTVDTSIAGCVGDSFGFRCSGPESPDEADAALACSAGAASGERHALLLQLRGAATGRAPPTPPSRAAGRHNRLLVRGRGDALAAQSRARLRGGHVRRLLLRPRDPVAATCLKNPSPSRNCTNASVACSSRCRGSSPEPERRPRADRVQRRPDTGREHQLSPVEDQGGVPVLGRDDIAVLLRRCELALGADDAGLARNGTSGLGCAERTR